MRIVHTSDWHAGRIWKGLQRLDELEATLDHLAGFVEKEQIDLLLVTGDIFDHAAPIAEAERIVFRFFRRIGLSGAQSVVIAGNHDHPARIEAWGTLAELVGVHAVARPSGPEEGGVLEIRTRSGEIAIVAALPFAGVGELLSAVEVAADETHARKRYGEALRGRITLLAQKFRKDAVNLVAAHTHLEGAILARSERPVHTSEQWAALPQAFPPSAHYVALGHIHRPQAIEASPAPARYAGSPFQLDFGEAGQEKSFVLVEASAGVPARITTIPYRGGKELRDLKLTLDEVRERADELAGAWLRVTVPLDAPDPDVAAKVRALLPGAVDVRVELPPVEAEPSILAQPAARPRDEYAAYVVAARKREATPELLDAFDELLRECTEEGG